MYRFFKMTVVATIALRLFLNSEIGFGEPKLLQGMKDLQYFTHKASLSIQANNLSLADFYLHELEETIEDLQKIKEYNGRPVGAWIKTQLLPPFSELEKMVDSKNIAGAKKALTKVITSCNSCHQASGKGMIRITDNKNNPYFQSFKP